MKRFNLLFIISVFTFNLYAQQKYDATWESIDSRPVPEWFTDAKFGIFIHWGLYSVPAWGPLPADGAGIYDCYAEWYWYRLMNEDKDNTVGSLFRSFHKKNYGENFKYQDFASCFSCKLFNPADWASLFRKSGAKYVVLTSKHHDGFALWPSEHSWNWNAMDIGPHRDLAGELCKAVKDTGIHFGFYYSLYEWFNPLYKKDPNRYVTEHMLPQIKDLVNCYHPDVIWTDGEWDYSSQIWKSTDFLAWLYNESPVKETVVVNDRWGKETRGKHGGYYTTEYDLIQDANVKGAKITHPWEECRGIGHSFGYNRNEKLNDYSSSAELIHLLIEKVALGGNLLLDIGPTADGRIPVIMQQRLTDMGKWLKINGEAIYESHPWEVASSQSDISAFFTQKEKDLYVICTRFPTEPFTVNGVSGTSISLLGSNAKITCKQNGKNLVIIPPKTISQEKLCNYAWVFKISNRKIE